VDARAVIVGFGDYRAELERLAEGLDVLFTGPLEHRHLVHLLALADAAVVPSIFPEAFGMVAAESAAAGCPPIVANHSGLAEIARGLERHYPPELRDLPAFTSGDADELRTHLEEQLALTGAEREALRTAAREATVALWSWTSVARRILAAAEGGAADDSGRPAPDG
jgi:glycosyltransferase involved in cell wall biosynthesis